MKLNKIVNHNLFKASLIYTISDAINKSVPFFVLPILSYYILPADYGIIANFNVILAVVSIFIMIGVDGAIGVQFFKLKQDDLAKFNFNALLMIASITMIVFFFIVGFHREIYNWVKIPFKYQLLVVVMGFSTTITAINLTLWRLEEKPIKFGFYEISQTIINISISLILVIIFKLGWVGRIGGMFTASLVFGVYSIILLFKRKYLIVNYDKNYLKYILFFGLPLVPHALSFWVRSGIDRIYITKFIGEAATGLYATGFQFGLLISFLTISFNNAFVPYLYKQLSEKDEMLLEKNKKRIVKLTVYIIIGLGFATLFFCFFAYLMLNFLFSENYIKAKEFIIWAILAQTFQGFYLLFVNYIFFVNKTKGLAMITFACAFLQLFLSYFLIQVFGAIGAAYSTVIVSFINFVAVFLYSRKVYRMPWYGVNGLK
jgi:O-antigen/teichoic acid export membrane protein